jgi:cystathionine beta-lyase
MAGVVTVRDLPVDTQRSLPETMYFIQNSEGTGLAPFDCWLVLRGLKTMALRVRQQQSNAMAVAKWLTTCPQVMKVLYPGLDNHPDKDLHHKQAKGGGSVICFLTGNVSLSQHIVTTTKLFNITVSFGGVSSLISLPGKMSHASIPEEVRHAREFPEDLVRISIGIEDPEDLINDLHAAMASFNC